MSMLLRKGQTVLTELSGTAVILEKFIAAGGQGEVYAARMAGDLVAVKWYKPEVIACDLKLRSRLRQTRGREPFSSRTDRLGSRFVWPIDVVTSGDTAGFGYVMPFRETRFRDVDDLLLDQDSQPPSLRSRAGAALEIAEALRAVHAEGLCYRDINFGNIALDPLTAEVRICDNDNVGRDDGKNGERGGVGGYPGFMAPEIVHGLSVPTRDTDLWSMAVLLFHLFIGIGEHPLLGRRAWEHHVWTPEVEQMMLGAQALFIFNPYDRSNEPVEDVHQDALRFWPIYPQVLRDLFTRAFTNGIRNPEHRIRMSEWMNVMASLRDSIALCPQCGTENFYEEGKRLECWNCGRQMPAPLRIELANHAIVLAENAALFPYHLHARKGPYSSKPIARVVRHPKHADIIGLENLGARPWRVTNSCGKEATITANERVGLEPDMRITFGDVMGLVR